MINHNYKDDMVPVSEMLQSYFAKTVFPKRPPHIRTPIFESVMLQGMRIEVADGLKLPNQLNFKIVGAHHVFEHKGTETQLHQSQPRKEVGWQKDVMGSVKANLSTAGTAANERPREAAKWRVISP